MSTKTAVIIFNLGGPDHPQAIRPFLFNFFMDKNIIRLPWPLRFLVAQLISFRRSRAEAANSYAVLGGRSPLLENTQAQAQALSSKLNQAGAGVFKTFIAMRYWHPLSGETARQVKDWNPDRIVLLPFYPQYSTTTTRSSFQAWQKAAKSIGLEKPTALCCCYPFVEGFIGASAKNIRSVYDPLAMQEKAAGRQSPRVLFSAHGLPRSVIRQGDPYQWQCEEGAKAIARATGIENLDWAICYQSRVGPQEWIGPSTGEELLRAAKDSVAVVIYPHAFVNEHVETLVEIEHEYKEMALNLGVPAFARVPTVSEAGDFIAGLAGIVRELSGRSGIAAAGGGCLCPARFGQCCQREHKAGLKALEDSHARVAA